MVIGGMGLHLNEINGISITFQGIAFAFESRKASDDAAQGI